MCKESRYSKGVYGSSFGHGKDGNHHHQSVGEDVLGSLTDNNDQECKWIHDRLVEGGKREVEGVREGEREGESGHEGIIAYPLGQKRSES